MAKRERRAEVAQACIDRFVGKTYDCAKNRDCIKLAAHAIRKAGRSTGLLTKLSQARLRLVAAPEGGNPAVVELYSDNNATNFVRISAAQIMLGANTTFDTAASVWRTTAVGGLVRVMAFGAPFGANSNLLEWWGPSSVPIGSMTTANGYNGRMTAAPYVFDNTLASGGSVTGVGNVPVTLDGPTKKTVVTADMVVTANSMVEAAFSVMGQNSGPLGGNNSNFEGGWEITDRASPSGGETVVWSGTWTAYQDAEGLMSYTFSPDGFQPARRALAAGTRRYSLKAWRVSGTTIFTGAGNITVRKT